MLVLFALWFLITRAGDNLRANQIPTGWDFLEINPGVALSEGIDTDPETGGRALWVGMVNTIRLAIAGIIVSTIIGVLAGIGRLSSNWIVRRLSSVYIELLRNIPLLVTIYLLAAIISTLPRVESDQGPIHGWIHLSNKGLSVPRIFIADGFYQWSVFVIVGIVVGLFVRKRRMIAQDATGQETYPMMCLFGVVIAFAAVGWFAHPLMGWVGSVFAAISDGISAIPEEVVRYGVVLASFAVAGWWIKRRLDRLRTPAGLGKLTDDDYFRMIFTVISAALVSTFIVVVWPGLASWIVNSSSDLFEVLSNKFGDGRSGQPIDAMRPDIVQSGNFPNYGPAGLNFTLGLAAVYFGLVLYTGAFIAEIVRGGILAVPKGQNEAAEALGLRPTTKLRLVILPQALRVSLPPLGNQYLNLTKNTSLAIAVGYSEIVQVGQTIYNQTGKTLEVVSIWMLFYLACSLTISSVVNFFNVRLKIVER